MGCSEGERPVPGYITIGLGRLLGQGWQRQALVRQADDILEQDPALLPLAWLKCNDAWYSYVKGCNPTNFFGTYDVVRWDTAWLDK